MAETRCNCPVDIPTGVTWHAPGCPNLRAREPAPVEEREAVAQVVFEAASQAADDGRGWEDATPDERAWSREHADRILALRSRSPEPSEVERPNPIALAEQICAEGWVGDSETPLDGYGMECIREFARVLAERAPSTGDEPVGGSDG